MNKRCTCTKTGAERFYHKSARYNYREVSNI